MSDYKKWYPVCSECGKKGVGGGKFLNRPTSNPPSMGGKCPSSYDGKHKPMWTTDD